MNVLSLFDGMSGAQIALNRAGIKYDKYLASEVDEYAIAVTQHNYPDTIQLGDVTKIKASNLPRIDLLIGGSPCQGFSFAGKQLNFDDPRSKLFFEFVRLLRELKPKYFLLENVVMKKEYQDIISDHLGVQPVMINSALVSAQSRKRLYWSNLNITEPEDRGIYLLDIIESGWTDSMKSYCIDASYFKGGNLKQYFEKSRRQLVFENGLSFVMGSENGRRLDDVKNLSRNYSEGYRVYPSIGKSSTLTARSKGGAGGYSGLYLVPALVQEGYINQNHRGSRYYNINGKSVTLTASGGGWGMKTGLYLIPTTREQVYKTIREMIDDGDIVIRKLTPVECERLQTVPDNYTLVPHPKRKGMMSDTQRYKMLGNGFTVDVIAHILRHINEN